MSTRRAAVANGFAIVVAAVAWPALMLQYWLALWSGPWLSVTVRYLSFFTILSNLLVALVASSVATGGDWPPWRIWRQPRVGGLAALCITVTGLVYAVVLQGLWHPQGPQLIADRMLHDIVPILFVAWWVALSPHGTLAWGDAFRWLLFPLVYLVWTVARGLVVHDFPYPFMNADQLGWASVALNSLGVGALFLVLGLILVGLDKALARA